MERISGSFGCGPLQDLLDPLGLLAHVVLLRGGRARRRSGTASRPPRAARRRSPRVERVDEHARLGGTNSGGPPMLVATTERPQAIASSTAWPNGSIRLGWQTTCAAAIRAGSSSCGTTPASSTRSRPSSCAPQRPVADEGQRPLAEPRERVGQPDDVLALGQRADAEEARAVRPGARLDGGSARGRRRESTTSVLPRASGTFASSSRRR